MRSPVLSPRQFQWVLGAFASTLVAHMLWMPPWYSLLLGSVILARWMQRRRYARAWPGWIKFPLLFAVLAVVLIEYGNPFERQAGTAALAGFCTLKLIESERQRDGLLMLTVCLFLVSVQFLFNQGILISMYMAVPTLVTFLAMSEVSAPPETQGGLVSRLGMVTRELMPLLAVTLPLTLFLFLTVPRMSEPLWGSPTAPNEARTGLSDEMAPGSITELLGDDTPVMRVIFDGPTPPQSALYWRGPVLWNYDGITWRSARIGQNLNSGQLEGPQTAAPGHTRYRVSLEATDRNWLFLLDFPTGFPADSRRLPDGQVLRRQPILSLYNFDAASDLSASAPVSAQRINDEMAGLRLTNQFNPKTTELAQSWLAEVGNDRTALVERALQYFREEKFFYSLTPPPLISGDRVDEFLFGSREGFCEHYSSAFVVLMRSAGVPARVVTGYLGGQENPVGGYLVVRNSDAHAWSEVLIAGRGWVRVDPTAAVSPERIDRGFGSSASVWGRNSWLRSVRDRFDALQAWWNRSMVRFDRARQNDFFADLGIDPSDWRQAAAWMGGGLGVIALLGAAMFYRRLGRARDPSARAYRRFLQRLHKLGIDRIPSEGPLDFGSRAGDRFPQWAEAITAVSQAYADARYAPTEAVAPQRLLTAVERFLQLCKS